MEYLYCGGRFDFDYNDAAFEKKVAKDYRAILLNDVNKLLNNSDVVVLSSLLAYIGPYYFETDGCWTRISSRWKSARLRDVLLQYSSWIIQHVREPLQKWFMPRRFKKEF